MQFGYIFTDAFFCVEHTPREGLSSIKTDGTVPLYIRAKCDNRESSFKLDKHEFKIYEQQFGPNIRTNDIIGYYVQRKYLARHEATDARDNVQWQQQCEDVGSCIFQSIIDKMFINSKDKLIGGRRGNSYTILITVLLVKDP